MSKHMSKAEGAKLGIVISRPLPNTCPECGHVFAVAAGLAAHLREDHGAVR